GRERVVLGEGVGFLGGRRIKKKKKALRKRLQVSERVRSDSSWPVIPARERVPGDIVRVRPGDIIFFSSRSRHTRLVSDWSSDECSSDLMRHVSHGRGATTLLRPTRGLLSPSTRV